MSYTLNFEANRYQHILLHNWEGCQISARRQVNMTEVLCGFPYSLHAGSGILPHNPTICVEGRSQHSVGSIQSRLWTRQPGFRFLAEASLYLIYNVQRGSRACRTSLLGLAHIETQATQPTRGGSSGFCDSRVWYCQRELRSRAWQHSSASAFASARQCYGHSLLRAKF